VKYDHIWSWKFSACQKKKPYHDKQAADSMCGQQRKKSGHDLIVYKCPFQPHYHIGHRKVLPTTGPKIYCPSCDEKILTSLWDKHHRRLHRASTQR
jgi:hypothetical protein